MLDFNRPETWVTTEIHNRPPFDAAAYQARIDSICGLNPFGGSNILLSWCPDIDNYSKIYCEWNEAGFGTKTHLRGSYVFQTIWDGDGNPIDVPAPRWVLKQFLHPSQYLAADNVVRWKKFERGKQTIVKEHRPPRPQDGIYVPLDKGVIRKHDGTCCRTAQEAKTYCWGFYRAPDESYLTLLKKAVKERDAAGVQNPNEPISARAMAAAALEAGRDIENRKKRGDQSVSEFVETNVNSLLAEITKDKSFLTRDKSYSFNQLILTSKYGNN